MPGTWPLEVVPLSPVSCGTVLWRSGGAFRVTVIVKATFVLRPDADAVSIAPRALEREDRHRADDPGQSVKRASDLAPYLPSTGVMLTGHANAPGAAVTALSARLAIFRDTPLLDKTLHVFGDIPPGGSAPAPFTKVPLVYERAYGGQGVDANPVGVGAPGSAARPNVVDPGDPTHPAGFGPIARSWPSRARWLARVDEHAAVVAIPEGFDFRAYSAAPPDQQIPFLEGDEWIVMDNLVASRPRLQTRLPSARARARWHLVTAGGASQGHDVSMLLDTLTLDADKLLASVVWRGHFVLELPDLVKLVRVYAGLELPGQPIPWPERSAVAPRRELAGGAGATAAGAIAQYVGSALPFVDQDSQDEPYRSPEAPRPRGEPDDSSGETSIFASPFSGPALPFGAPPPSYRAEAPATPSQESDEEELPFGRTSAISAEDAARAMKLALAPFELAAPGAKPRADAPAIPGAPWSSRAAPRPMPPEEMTTAELEEPPERAPVAAPPNVAPPPRVGPLPPIAPPPRVAPPRTEPPSPEPAALPAPSAAIVDESRGRAAAPVESEARLRAKARLAEGASFDDADLSGADLSGLDFSGRSLVRCKLQGAKLAGAHLHGALLTGAQMSGADLSGAGLEGADLTRADLGQATLKNARLDGAKLADAKLAGADGAGASFRKATGQRTGFSKGIWTGAVFDDADITAADFTGASLDRASFRGASLPEVRLNEAQATEAVFDRAKLPDVRAKSASFVRCSLEEVDASRGQFGKAILTGSTFANADLRSASFNEAQCAAASFAGANLREAHFEDAELERAKLAGADLEGAKLTRAHGEGADFEGAKLGDADLRKARFPRGSFANAKLRGARAEEADFTGARFDSADLSAAGLRGAKLAGARLTNARLDGTDLRHADLEGANVHGASRATAKLAGANVKGLVETPPDDA